MSLNIDIFEGPLSPCGGGGPSLSALLELQTTMDANEWRRISDAAQVVANYLACHPAVAELRYPGLTSDPDYQEASGTLRGGFGPELHLRLANDARWCRYIATDEPAAAQVLALEDTMPSR